MLFGRSLGSALAVYVAAQHPASSLIIESAFTSSEDMADLYYPFLKHLMATGSNYDTSGLIGKVEIPKLIVHSERDEIIPLWMGKRLFELAREPKEMYVIPGAGHNDTYAVGGKEYFARLRSFIEGRLFTEEASRAPSD